MSKRKLGLNKHQKAAHRPGERRVGREDIELLLEMSRSDNPEEREVAAKYLCPCHVRRRIDEVWKALYRMMEDADVRVRRASWHTLEDGGRIDNPQMDEILDRALRTERDVQVRRFVKMFTVAKERKEEVEIKLALQSEFDQRGKCDFCGRPNVYVKRDIETEIPDGGSYRLALVCEQCAIPIKAS